MKYYTELYDLKEITLDNIEYFSDNNRKKEAIYVKEIKNGNIRFYTEFINMEKRKRRYDYTTYKAYKEKLLKGVKNGKRKIN